MITNKHVHFNVRRRLHTAATGRCVMQGQGPLNLCCSVDSNFPINKLNQHRKINSLICFANKEINKAKQATVSEKILF